MPRIWEGSPPVTRLRTWLWALCCTKRVVSFVLMEKPFQLMMVPGVLVTVSVLPAGGKVGSPVHDHWCGRVALCHSAQGSRYRGS